MLAAFRVGENERHHVEVYSRYIGLTGLEIVKVDGAEVLRKTKFPIWFTDRLHFNVGEQEQHHVELRYRNNLLSLTSEAYVDGELHVGCLFPQATAYNAVIWAIGAFVLVITVLAIMAYFDYYATG